MGPHFIQLYEELKKVDEMSDPQMKAQRGRDFEELINDVFASEGVLIRRGFHTSDNRSEQIDGAIEVWKRILLIEVKWVEGNLAASDLFSFIGKVENKFNGTIGLFISKNKLSENFVRALNSGRKQCVIIMHGEDIDLLFQADSPSFSNYIEYCLKLFSYDNLNHLPVSEYIKVYRSPKLLQRNTVQQVQDFIERFLNTREIVDSNVLASYFDPMTPEAKIEVINYAMENLDIARYGFIDAKVNAQSLNFDELFGLLKGYEEIAEKIAVKYFQEIIAHPYSIYGTGQIFEIFSPFYKTLPVDERAIVEAKLVEGLDSAGKYGDRRTEVVITFIAKVLWSSFTLKTKDDLKARYFSYLVSSSRFADSEEVLFAKELVSQNEIDKNFIEDWMLRKIEKLTIDLCYRADEDMIAFFVRTYLNVAHYMELSDIEFQTFVRENVDRLIRSKS